MALTLPQIRPFQQTQGEQAHREQDIVHPESPRRVTRFAPSPTGLLHLGNYRTALFNFLYAKQHQGKFILRIEDTDRERNKKEYEEDILESLKWLNLPYDEFYRQSERKEIYQKHLQRLLDEGKAYVSQEQIVEEGNPSTRSTKPQGGEPVESTERFVPSLSTEGLRARRSEVIRFKNPGTKVTFKDLIRGEVTFDTTELKDFVIAKSLEEPIFHFAVVVDDFEMGVTHVIRGEDHISNTPRQILIQEALGAPRPLYAHLPLILSPDRSKLSKRNGAISVKESREKGYLPEAIINYLALLGWNPGNDQEILSLENLLLSFSLEKVQKAGAVFNEAKLNWVNKEYLKKLPEETVEKEVQRIIAEGGLTIDKNTLRSLISLIVERIEKFADVKTLLEKGELDCFFKEPSYAPEGLVWKESEREKTLEYIRETREMLSRLSPEEFNATSVRERIFTYAEEKGRGAVLWPLRFALSGKAKSPDPFTIAGIIGKEKTLERLKKAIDLLSHQ